MKKVVLLSALAICVIAALFVFRTREKNVTFGDFAWSERNGIVTFEFRVANLSEEEVVVSVELIAERKLELRTGPQIAEAGRSRIEVRLTAKEAKKEHGQMALAPAVRGDLTIFPYVTVKNANSESSVTQQPSHDSG